MISIKNSQRSITVNIKKLKKEAKKILTHLGYQEYDLGIWLTTNKTIRTYNKKYRHKDTATDILSFAYHPSITAGKHIPVLTEDDKNLGDLIISVEYVRTAAQKLGVGLPTRIQTLLVHGICHLLGYDHIKETDYRIMQRKENELLKLL